MAIINYYYYTMWFNKEVKGLVEANALYELLNNDLQPRLGMSSWTNTWS